MEYTAQAARELLQSGKGHDGMVVRGSLKWDGKVPKLPTNLSCLELDLSGTSIRELPTGLQVPYRLCLRDCTSLRSLPTDLKAGTLDLRGCVALTSLPEGLDVSFLDLVGCRQFREWPQKANGVLNRLRLRDCTSLRELPAWLKRVGQLNLRGCANLAALPKGLIVTDWLDLGGTRITQLPKSLTDVSLRWRGIPISPRIAFQPETITAKEILGEKNAELRRVLLERMGFEQFLSQAKADVLHKDRDAGGERRLLRVRLKDDEDLVCVSVFCPSTARQYLIRVPPTMTTCRQAIAWTAGFDNPDDYRPLVET